jgi:hypothetical protein
MPRCTRGAAKFGKQLEVHVRKVTPRQVTEFICMLIMMFLPSLIGCS